VIHALLIAGCALLGAGAFGTALAAVIVYARTPPHDFTEQETGHASDQR